ncbi:MAG: hypothetical protein A2W35_11575 [Chloroflexi bacterium RBG_16_57_11]|nr:MAG: hypothetical protein A2W35_11575 [Chloroflexi bacterium RBG_16_57_11]
MQNRLLRLPLLLSALLALLFGLWAGLLRMGWDWPMIRPALPMSHGPLMVSAFFGTLIALERAMALNKRWAYLGPLCSGVGGVLLVLNVKGVIGPLLSLGGLVLALVCLWMWRHHPALHSAIIAAGAVGWLVGSLLWLVGSPVYQVVFWWSAFLVFTIAGERLELSRVRHPALNRQRMFAVITGVIFLGLLWLRWDLIWGERMVGLGYFSLAVWLWVHDLARVTVRQHGLTRYIAVCLLCGFVWLGVGGLLSLFYAGYSAGPIYDARLHAIFVGFVISMVFGHAPIIFPAVLGSPTKLGLPIAHRSYFYLPLVMLHLSLMMRLAGDFGGRVLVRQWGGLLNALAILLFLAMILPNIIYSKGNVN